MGLTQIPWHGGSRLCLCGPRDVSASSPSGSGRGPREARMRTLTLRGFGSRGGYLGWQKTEGCFCDLGGNNTSVCDLIGKKNIPAKLNQHKQLVFFIRIKY